MNYFRLFLLISLFAINPLTQGMEKEEKAAPIKNSNNLKLVFTADGHGSLSCPLCPSKITRKPQKYLKARLKNKLLEHIRKKHNPTELQIQEHKKSLDQLLGTRSHNIEKKRKRKEVIAPEETQQARLKKRKRERNKAITQPPKETLRKMITIEANAQDNSPVCRALLRHILDNDILSDVIANRKLNIGLSQSIQTQIDCGYNTNFCRAVLRAIFENHLTHLN